MSKPITKEELLDLLLKAHMKKPEVCVENIGQQHDKPFISLIEVLEDEIEACTS